MNFTHDFKKQILSSKYQHFLTLQMFRLRRNPEISKNKKISNLNNKIIILLSRLLCQITPITSDNVETFHFLCRHKLSLTFCMLSAAYFFFFNNNIDLKTPSISISSRRYNLFTSVLIFNELNQIPSLHENIIIVFAAIFPSKYTVIGWMNSSFQQHRGRLLNHLQELTSIS